MSDDSVKLELKGLDQLIKALKVDPPSIRVGVLAGKDPRQRGKATSNATVGAAHEFGTDVLPQRSFLRVPLTDNLQKEMEKSGALDKETLKEVIKTGSIMVWARKIAVLAEGIVAEAFDTGGFGKWAPVDMTKKQNHQILVETQQLRNSITSEVK